VYDQIDFRNDSVLLETKRIWPLLELLKALSVFPDFNNENKMSLVLNILLERYIQPNGFWIERLHKNWTEPDYIMPTSSAYHIAMALLETRGFILRKI
jgi:mannose/cellobiose epimerase-like protein (N-acyl-D-glucosamine 2-epimerase family)